MRGARTRPMLMTLLFSVIVSVGTGMVNFVSRLLRSEERRVGKEC